MRWVRAAATVVAIYLACVAALFLGAATAGPLLWAGGAILKPWLHYWLG